MNCLMAFDAVNAAGRRVDVRCRYWTADPAGVVAKARVLLATLRTPKKVKLPEFWPADSAASYTLPHNKDC